MGHRLPGRLCAKNSARAQSLPKNSGGIKSKRPRKAKKPSHKKKSLDTKTTMQVQNAQAAPVEEVGFLIYICAHIAYFCVEGLVRYGIDNYW
jgi:hypothetical protein